ncbi:MAG: hypothetical protein OIN87_08345 [Candidatus Methanoperedens sp.]|nr:hypothetical protein [Candidatus Methanoperedens sp.]
MTDFDSGFIPYEIEYGVVMDQLSRIYKSWKSTIREYIANAESACISTLKLDPNYVPEIRVEYNPEQCLLTIEDNGIGLSKKMFMEVFRYFGRSRNAFDPSVSGMFGLVPSHSLCSSVTRAVWLFIQRAERPASAIRCMPVRSDSMFCLMRIEATVHPLCSFTILASTSWTLSRL